MRHRQRTRETRPCRCTPSATTPRPDAPSGRGGGHVIGPTFGAVPEWTRMGADERRTLGSDRRLRRRPLTLGGIATAALAVTLLGRLHAASTRRRHCDLEGADPAARRAPRRRRPAPIPCRPTRSPETSPDVPVDCTTRAHQRRGGRLARASHGWRCSTATRRILGPAMERTLGVGGARTTSRVWRRAPGGEHQRLVRADLLEDDAACGARRRPADGSRLRRIRLARLGPTRVLQALRLRPGGLTTRTTSPRCRGRTRWRDDFVSTSRFLSRTRAPRPPVNGRPGAARRRAPG